MSCCPAFSQAEAVGFIQINQTLRRQHLRYAKGKLVSKNLKRRMLTSFSNRFQFIQSAAHKYPLSWRLKIQFVKVPDTHESYQYLPFLNLPDISKSTLEDSLPSSS